MYNLYSDPSPFNVHNNTVMWVIICVNLPDRRCQNQVQTQVVWCGIASMLF